MSQWVPVNDVHDLVTSTRVRFVAVLALIVMPVTYILIPVEQARASAPAILSWAVALLLLLASPWFVPRWARLAFGVCVAVAVYGVIISPELVQSIFSTPVRRAGGLDWLAWTMIGLYLPAVVATSEPIDWERKFFGGQSRWRTLLEALVVVGTLQAFAALVLEPLLGPGQTSAGYRVGVTGNAGFLGLWCLVGFLGAAWLSRVPNSERWWVLFAAVCAIGLYLSGARAAWLGAGLALPLLLPSKKLVLAGYVVVLSAGAAITPFVYQIRPQTIPERVQYVYDVVGNFSWLGHGWYSFKWMAHGGQYADFPHNIPLQLVHELGVLGVAIVVFVVYLFARYLRGPWAVIGVGWGVYSLFWIPSAVWFIVWMVLLGRALWAWSGTPDYVPEPMPETAQKAVAREVGVRGGSGSIERTVRKRRNRR